MALYEFTLILAPLMDDFSDALCNRVYEACGEVEFGQIAGIPQLGFVREAPSFEFAVGSAIADAAKAGLRVVRVQRTERGFDESAATAINASLGSAPAVQ